MLSSVLISMVIGALCIFFAYISKNNTLKIGLGIIGVCLIFYGGYGYGAINPLGQGETYDTGSRVKVNYPVEKVQLTSPVDGDVVSCRILTMGVYPESHEKDIWVLLKPSDEKYYPQSDYTNTSYKENGKWQVVTRFGGDKGEVYELVVYEADTAASEFFSDIIVDWKLNDDYVGLLPEEIPAGAKEIERIKLTLEGNCRGIH